MGDNELIENIKEWLISDEKIKDLQKQIRTIKKNKKILESNLLHIMKNNNVEEEEVYYYGGCVVIVFV